MIPGEAPAIWAELREQARELSVAEPVLASFYHTSVLRHDGVESALTSVLAARLSGGMLSPMILQEIIQEVMGFDPSICDSACADLRAHRSRDPACDSYILPFLSFKGFHALQTHRVAHALWLRGRRWLALVLQECASVRFDVDIHPGARMGRGIMIDHGTGIVIGETAVVGDEVSMLHGVTLGGSGRTAGQRHPTVRSGVLFGAGAKALGPVTIGEGARIGAGSLVLEDVPPHATVAGVPARIVGKPLAGAPALEMDQRFADPADAGAPR